MKRILRSGHREVEFLGRLHGIEPVLLGGEKPKDRPQVQPGGGSPGGIAPPKKKTWITFRVVDDATSKGISGVDLILTKPDGWKSAKTTDAQGEVKLVGIDPESYAVSCLRDGAQLVTTLDFVTMGEASVGTKPFLASKATTPSGPYIICEIEEHQVHLGESILSLATANKMTWQELAIFNWGTAVPQQINVFLYNEVGCRRPKGDFDPVDPNANYMFTDNDKTFGTGMILIPKEFKRVGLGTEQVHVIRTRMSRETATIKVKWTKQEVTPNHNNAWPPATPPTDTIPEEAKVTPLVETTNVPDGTTGRIKIFHCRSGASVPNGELKDLKIKGNQLVDPATNAPPVWVFEAANFPWDPWNSPFFYFTAEVDFDGLKAQTESDNQKNAAATLRVLYWHESVSDAIADTPAGGGLTTGAEMAEIAGIIAARAKHKVDQRAVNQRNVPVALWGSILRNTYIYHHASHGDIVDRTTGAQLNAGGKNPPTVAVGNWRSTIVLGRTNLGDAETNQVADVPSTPRFLAYMDTCVAGWEPSFGNAMVKRGTRNFLAFRKYIPDGDARQMARDFYKQWRDTYGFNPDKIPDVFFSVGNPYYGSMRPILFGQGGGAVKSKSQRALDAIGDAIDTVVKSIKDIFR